MKPEPPPPRVLAIDPTSRGFGFAILEGPATLVDWGVSEIHGRSPGIALVKLTDLLKHYEPDVLVVEDCTDSSSRRGPRARRLIEAACGLAASMGVQTTRITITAVCELFDDQGAMTKHSIATVIADHVPSLAKRLPPKRKPWMSEAERMAIFDATAFGLTFYFLTDAEARR